MHSGWGETYAPVGKLASFRYLASLAAGLGLDGPVWRELAELWREAPRHCGSVTASRLFSHPPAPLSGSLEIGGVRAGARDSPGRPLGPGRPPS